jgi:beta-N-acetylhexosaminidase
MTESTERLAHAVLLPAIADLESAALELLLERGCRAVLLGETRAEYLARAIRPERVRNETPEIVLSATAALRERAPEELLVAVDHEIVGIRRFAHLLPPDRGSTPAEVRAAAAEAGMCLRELGVNVVLGPIIDVVRGKNPWLSGRNLGPDAGSVAAMGCAAVEGLQAGGVAAVAKHYPGHAVVFDDPAVAPAVVRTPIAELDDADDAPFAAVVAAGVRGIMLGPAVVEAIDSSEAASCSNVVVTRARERLGFDGTLVSDDLDAVGIRRGRSVGESAVAALAAGADLLLVAASAAEECAKAIAAAVADGHISAERLTEAAVRAGNLAPLEG